jgi:hypothetical protein
MKKKSRRNFQINKKERTLLAVDGLYQKCEKESYGLKQKSIDSNPKPNEEHYYRQLIRYW